MQNNNLKVDSKQRVQAPTKHETPEDEIVLGEVLVLLDSVTASRLIEQIARPSPLSDKQKIIDKVFEQIRSLQEKLLIIQTEATESDNNQRESTMKGKSVSVGSASNRVPDWNKSIRLIEAKYSEVHFRLQLEEVFIEGNLKYFNKVSGLLGIARTLQPIDIEGWANSCLRNRRGKDRGCCD